jgi:hypothetical protein
MVPKDIPFAPFPQYLGYFSPVSHKQSKHPVIQIIRDAAACLAMSLGYPETVLARGKPVTK